MAKEKKRGFFSWLGFGQKEQTRKKETEVQNEQSVVEEMVRCRACGSYERRLKAAGAY